jgi:hypothetical protein
VIRRLFLPVLAVAAVGAVAKSTFSDIARYLKIRAM